MSYAVIAFLISLPVGSLVFSLYRCSVSLCSIARSLETIVTLMYPPPTAELTVTESEELDPETRHRMRTKLRRDEWRNNASA